MDSAGYKKDDAPCMLPAAATEGYVHPRTSPALCLSADSESLCGSDARVEVCFQVKAKGCEGLI